MLGADLGGMRHNRKGGGREREKEEKRMCESRGENVFVCEKERESV